jgi:hypothetical protein
VDKLQRAGKVKYIKYYVPLLIMIISLFNSHYFAFSIEGKKDPRLHQASHVAIYRATSKNGFNCSMGYDNLAITNVKHPISNGTYSVNIPYNLPFYEDFSLGCGFELSQIQLVIRHPGEYDEEIYDHGNTGEDKEFSILEYYDYHKDSTFHAAWRYDIKNSKKYFKLPQKTQLYCYTEAERILDNAEATDKEREMFALGEKTTNPIHSELFCAFDAPKKEYTYHYTIQNKQKVVTYITHPDIGTNTINKNESFHIDLLVNKSKCFLHRGGYDSNDKVPDKFREKYVE